MNFESLGKLVHIKHGYAFKSEYFSLDTGRQIVLTPGNFFDGGGFKLRSDKDRFYTGDFPREFILKKNDVIIAMTEQTYGLLGSPAIIPENDKFLHNQRLGKFELLDDSRANLKYLYYLFCIKSLRDEISISATGTKIRHTAPERIYRIKVPLPKLDIQRKIAAVLSAYDDLIENNNRRIAILEKMAEELYREWFVRLRFPGHEKVKVVKGVPEGWEVKDSLRVFHVLGGGTPKTENPVFWDGDIPFFTPKDSHTGYFANVTEKSITPVGLESCNSKLYAKNTIFITARGTVGNIVLALRPMAMNQSCYALVPKSGKHIYFHFLSMRDAVNIIKGTANSGVFDNIITDSFKQIKLFQPQEKLMSLFSDKAKPIMAQMENIVGKNALLTSIRDRLLSRLMSGKIDVEKLDIRFPESMKEEGVGHA